MYTGSVFKLSASQLLPGGCYLAVHWLCVQCCELIADKLEALCLYVPETCPAALPTTHSTLFTRGAEQHVPNLYAHCMTKGALACRQK